MGPRDPAARVPAFTNPQRDSSQVLGGTRGTRIAGGRGQLDGGPYMMKRWMVLGLVGAAGVMSSAACSSNGSNGSGSAAVSDVCSKANAYYAQCGAAEDACTKAELSDCTSYFGQFSNAFLAAIDSCVTEPFDCADGGANVTESNCFLAKMNAIAPDTAQTKLKTDFCAACPDGKSPPRPTLARASSRRRTAAKALVRRCSCSTIPSRSKSTRRAPWGARRARRRPIVTNSSRSARRAFSRRPSASQPRAWGRARHRPLIVCEMLGRIRRAQPASGPLRASLRDLAKRGQGLCRVVAHARFGVLRGELLELGASPRIADLAERAGRRGTDARRPCTKPRGHAHDERRGLR